MQNNYQVLKIKHGKVFIEMNETLFNHINVTLGLTPIYEDDMTETRLKAHKFQRRIVPFFMNQFVIWAKSMDYKGVENYLKSIRNRKTSKQQKWEVGDLQKLFGPINPRAKNIQTETQNRWKEFLNDQAEQSVLVNSKIKDQQTKTKYLNAVQQLKDQLKNDFPYHRFLSLSLTREKSASNKEESQVAQSNTYFEQDFIVNELPQNDLQSSFYEFDSY